MGDPVINEFVANHVGTDDFEYLEIKGDALTDYSGWTLVQIEGDAGSTTGRILSATAIGTTDADGYWSSEFLSGLLQNGSGTLLLVENYTGSIGQDLDTNDDGILDATPWGPIADGVAIDDGGAGDRFYTGTVLTRSFDGAGQTVGGASRLPDGVDTDSPSDWVRNDFDLAGLPGQTGTPASGEALNTPGAANTPVSTPQNDPLINEFVANHVGADNSEYFEIKGDALTDYSGWTLVQIEGDAGSTTGRIISATAIGTTDADGYWSTGLQSDLLQNGSGTLLLVENYTGSIGQDLDTDNDGILDATPWGEIADGVAIDDGGAGDRFYTGTVLTRSFDGADQTVGGASRLPDGVDTDSPSDWARNDFDLAGLPGQTGTPAAGEALNTPGAANAPVSVPEAEFHRIYEIQGAGHQSEFDGVLVATRGVVTAIADNGFYIQDAEGDGDSATSDAVFVFTGGAPPASVQLGVTLDVTGTVDEFQPGGTSSGNLTVTEITGPTIEVSAEQQTVPVAVNIGAGGYAPPTEVIDDDGGAVFDPDHDGIDYWESLEGMLVEVPAPVVVGPTNDFGEIYVLADGGDNATGTRTGDGGILLSETDQQPERIQIDDDLIGGTAPDVNVGAELGTIEGVVSYNFGWYEVQATAPITVESPGGLTPETTTLTGDSDHLTIGSINVENLDPKIEDINLVENQDPDNVDDDVGSGKFDQLAQQIVVNMQAPDIVALQEMQDSDGAEITGNTSAAETAQVLIDAIVALGGPRYEYVEIEPAADSSGGQPGGNIRVGYLYNPERVDLVEDSVQALTDPDLSDGDAFADSRQPLAADFIFNGEVVTVVNNHFTSKGGSSPTYGEDFPPENGGEDQREAQAAIVNDFVDGKLAADPDAMVMVVGDLNEFSWNDPMEVLRGEDGTPVLADLADTLLPPAERWSYVFEGASQELDHMLATRAAFDAGLEFDAVHTNAGFANQVSDHDPSVARLHIPATPENPIISVADQPTVIGFWRGDGPDHADWLV